jgi:hypothetical protein
MWSNCRLLTTQHRLFVPINPRSRMSLIPCDMNKIRSEKSKRLNLKLGRTSNAGWQTMRGNLAPTISFQFTFRFCGARFPHIVCQLASLVLPSLRFSLLLFLDRILFMSHGIKLICDQDLLEQTSDAGWLGA